LATVFFRTNGALKILLIFSKIYSAPCNPVHLM